MKHQAEIASLPVNLEALLRQTVQGAADPVAVIEKLRAVLHELSPQKAMPVDFVRWIPLEQVTPNDYNPNSVAREEMRLLYMSITHDGYTQPTVVVFNPARKLFEIVDGFHRYYVMKTNPDLYQATGGRLPCVVINKDINDRMASTVRHNRARGKHSVQGMSNLVFQMLENGWEDAEICNQLGMNAEELLRLKHITGFSKLFANVEYRKAWMTQRQIRIAAGKASSGKTPS